MSKFEFSIQLRGSNKVAVSNEELACLSAANQVVAILAHANGIKTPITKAKTKEGKEFSFVDEATCVAVMEALQK